MVKPLEAADLSILMPFKGGGFMPSLLGFMLYANGYSLRGTSRYCRNGLIFADGETLFAVGIFRKTMESETWHIMVGGERYTAHDRLRGMCENTKKFPNPRESNT